MKALVLVRHASAAWEAGSSDFDRPLTEAGQAEAREMAARLHELGLSPARVVSSPARRARQTAAAFVQAFALPPERWTVEPRIYEGSLRTLLELCAEQNDDEDCVLFVGHNPGFHAWTLAQSVEAPPGLPPAGVVVLQYSADSWAEVSGKPAASTRCFRP